LFLLRSLRLYRFRHLRSLMQNRLLRHSGCQLQSLFLSWNLL